MNSHEDNDLLHYLEWEAQVQGAGREHIENHGTVISAHTHNGLTIERIRLPRGVFRRVTKGGHVVSFTNLSESKKQIR